jgi:hypothetical protein
MGLKQPYGDYKEFVDADDLDVIYVATPHHLHHEGVTLALKTKPLVETGGIKQDQIDRLKGENRVVESTSNAAPTAAHS